MPADSALIGGGYGDAEWIDDQFDAARGERIGIRFITWSAAQTPSVVAASLQRRPAAVMLSLGHPMAFAADVHAAGAPLICQCQNLAHVRAALDAEADIVVAQGSEAGGHGADRGTFTLVPEVGAIFGPHLAGHPARGRGRDSRRERIGGGVGAGR